jgi:cytochrome P450
MPYTLDLFAEGYAEDPYPHYAELRDRAPAHAHPSGFWIVSRHADVVALQKGPHSVDERNLTTLPDWKHPGRENRMMGGLALLDQDPPDHTRLRRLVTRAFTRRAVDGLEPRIVALVDAALDRIAAAGTADVVAELAFPLPFTVISELLGVPPGDHERLRDLTGVLATGLEPLADPSRQAAIRAASEELTARIGALAAHKRGAPDLFGALLAAEEDGTALSVDEVVAQVAFLYVAGHETTMNLISGGLLALLRHPDQLRLLRADPGLAGAAVEELLRYDTPVHLMRRITREPVRVGEVEIPAGAWVVACLAAANRDPRFWGADADDLRLDRPNARHNVSFGAGAHHCLGAALARLEARIAFARFAERFDDPVLEELRWNGRINVRGPALLRVRVR